MDVLVTYDIRDTDGVGSVRLRRIADVCEKYGQRVQFSVFECRVSSTRLARMIGEIKDVIDPNCDSVIIYRFQGDIQNSMVRVGRAPERELGGPWLI